MGASASKRASAKRRAGHRARAEQRAHKRVRARPRRPNTRYKITRRTSERRLFLNPDAQVAEELNNLVGYCLAYATKKTGVQLHAGCVSSNHVHLDVLDRFGEAPAFKQIYFSFVARAVNAMRGRFESFWAPGGSCDTEPCDEACIDDDGHAFESSVLGDLVYTLTNPVKDGLVKHGDDWPGFTTYGWRFGENRTFRKPRGFFDPDNEDLPETLELTLVRPNLLQQLSDDEVSDQLRDEVKQRERYYRNKMRAENRRFMGVRKLRRQRWYRAPGSRTARFVVAPKVAGPSRWACLAGLQRNREWERQYAAARERWQKGDHEVVFPYGTDFMRRFIGVRVANAPP